MLQEAGFAASAPDLPGMGQDRTPLADVTLASTADFLAGYVRARRDVVLVGHSMAGPVISECAERVPDHLLGLVYVAANLVPSGQSMREAAGVDLDGVMTGVHVSADGLSSTYEPETALRVFYNTTDRAEAERAIARLTPQPLEPTSARLSLSAERYGSVPRAYVECLQDMAIPIAFQRRMQQMLPCEPVVTMDCDHSPFLCQPRALAEHIIDIARHFDRRRVSRPVT
jgi:pimeloyl-ACP methyl ester carboxylesterase